MNIHESGEMYLETILRLKKKGSVRSVDLVNELGYVKSSVSASVKTLKENGFIAVNEMGEIDFTPLGLKCAKDIFNRHVILTEFLTSLGVSAETAEADACKIEHIISEETFHVIKEQQKK